MHAKIAVGAKLTVSERPVVGETMANFLVDGRDDRHVTLAPLAPEVAALQLQQFQHVELQHRVTNTQSALEDRRRFEYD